MTVLIIDDSELIQSRLINLLITKTIALGPVRIFLEKNRNIEDILKALEFLY